MRTRQLSLWTKGLLTVEECSFPQDHDFTFIVGSRHDECHRFVALFLCPKLGRLYWSDRSFDSYCVNTQGTDDNFGELLTLGYGHRICVESGQVSFFVSVCGEFENLELCQQLIEDCDLTVTNAVSRFEMKRRFGFCWTIHCLCNGV
jgi:hypothetical protein